MDIHRARFVPFPTAAISAVAFSRSNDNGYVGPLPALKLAIGRSNGSVEIWNPQRGLWVQEAVFNEGEKSIDGLAWTQDQNEVDSDGQIILGQQRLFSIASSPEVTEWDLGTGQQKRKSTGNFSEVWCFAAQPRRKAQDDSKQEIRAQEIVAGCGDGTLVLLSTDDNDLQFKRFLARVSGKRARCMCVTYQTHDRVIAGFADSMIRVYDTRNGSMIRNMSLGVSVPGAPKNAIVWQVKCLPNGDIVSGDSNGEVKFWDGRTYSLSQRISGHETDCLDLITSTDGRTVISGSIDGKIAIYRQTNFHGRRSWAKNSHRRLHTGEVKAMAAYDSKALSVVVSGGSDVSPIVTPLREYGKENVRSLPSLPQDGPVVSAPKARLLVSWWDKTICIWRIARPVDVDSAPEPTRPRTVVARISLSTSHSIRSVAITADGRLLAVSTTTEIKAFQLRKQTSSSKLSIRKLDVSGELAKNGARLLSFSPDGRWLAAVTPDSEIYVARVTADTARPKRLQILQKVVELDRRHHKASQTAFKDYEQTISRLAFAPDSSVLVASDLSGHLDSWVLEGHEDLTAPAVDVAQRADDASSDAGSDSSSDSDSSDEDDSIIIFYGQHWTDNPAGHLLPKLEAPALIMTFRPMKEDQTQHALVNGNPGVHATRSNPHAHSNELPQGQHRLLVITSKHQMFEFDVLSGRLSDWSRRNPTSVLPQDLVKIRDRVMGSVWDVSGGRERIWLYGNSFVYMLNVGGDIGDGTDSQAVKKRGRKQDGTESDDFRKRRKLESGAGGKTDVSGSRDDAETQLYQDGETTLVESGNLDGPVLDDDDDDDEVDLSLIRGRSAGDEKQVAESSGTKIFDERNWWCTFKYRPILGMVPLEDEGEADQDRPLEVALVERVQWDAQKSS